MNLDIGVALVILEADVVMRAVLLDQVHFQDQGFQLRPNHDPLDISDMLDQLARFEIQRAAVLEVGAYGWRRLIALPT